MSRGQSKEKDFKRRVENNGPKLKNVPNVQIDEKEETFYFSDYVAKNIGSWAMIPADVDDEEEYVRKIAEEMYDIYESLETLEEATVEREEDGEMYWCTVEIKVPEDASRRERLAEEVGGKLQERQHI